jgi:hypothetical protein
MRVINGIRSALAAALVVAGAMAPTAARAQGAPPQQPMTAEQKLGVMKASVKQRFGFSDAQVDAFVKKAQTIAESYRPQLMSISKKYGNSPTPEQRGKMQQELFPILIQVSRKTNAALLGIATPAQRPRIQQLLQAEAKQLQMLQARMKSDAKASANKPAKSKG